MTDLIERLESAGEPTDKLMWECYDACFPDDKGNHAIERLRRFAGFLSAGAYLDAALTLVPEGWTRGTISWPVAFNRDDICGAVVTLRTTPIPGPSVQTKVKSYGKTLALATSAASLRARKV